MELMARGKILDQSSEMVALLKVDD